MGHLFARPEPHEVFGDLVEGLLSDLEKKNCWTLAQRAGHTHPGRMQSFLCRGAWSASALEAEVRDYVGLHPQDLVLLLDLLGLPSDQHVLDLRPPASRGLHGDVGEVGGAGVEQQRQLPVTDRDLGQHSGQPPVPDDCPTPCRTVPRTVCRT